MKPKGRLDRRTVTEIRQSLQEQHNQLKESLQSAMSLRPREDAGKVADPMDRATEALNGEIQATLLTAQARRVVQVEEALGRLMARGDYGVCQDCGEFIGVGRLRALPFAQRCARCQSGAELLEQRVARSGGAASGRGRRAAA